MRDIFFCAPNIGLVR